MERNGRNVAIEGIWESKRHRRDLHLTYLQGVMVVDIWQEREFGGYMTREGLGSHKLWGRYGGYISRQGVWMGI